MFLFLRDRQEKKYLEEIFTLNLVSFELEEISLDMQIFFFIN